MRNHTWRPLILFSLLLVFASGTSSVLGKTIKAGQLASIPIRHLHRTAFGAVQVSDAISETEYWELVEESHQLVTDLKGESDARIKQELATLAGRWEAVTSVRLNDGESVSLDNSYVLSLLQGEQPDVDHIISVFEALLSAHDEYPSGVFTTDDLDSLQQILSRPEFQWEEQGSNPIGEFFNRILQQLLKWLDKLLGGRSITIGGSWSPLYTVAVIALGIILFLVFRTLFVDFINESRIAEENVAEELLTPEAAFRKAQTLSQGGDYRSAVRFLYLSSLLLLDERGLLRYDRSKTNREYLQSISTSPELSRPLSEVIEVFDNVWYGYHPLDEDAFKHYSDRVEELKDKKQ